MISHPLLHRQNKVDLNLVHISSLERDQDFKDVIASIKRLPKHCADIYVGSNYLFIVGVRVARNRCTPPDISREAVVMG